MKLSYRIAPHDVARAIDDLRAQRSRAGPFAISYHALVIAIRNRLRLRPEVRLVPDVMMLAHQVGIRLIVP